MTYEKFAENWNHSIYTFKRPGKEPLAVKTPFSDEDKTTINNYISQRPSPDLAYNWFADSIEMFSKDDVSLGFFKSRTCPTVKFDDDNE